VAGPAAARAGRSAARPGRVRRAGPAARCAALAGPLPRRRPGRAGPTEQVRPWRAADAAGAGAPRRGPGAAPPPPLGGDGGAAGSAGRRGERLARAVLQHRPRDRQRPGPAAGDAGARRADGAARPLRAGAPPAVRPAERAVAGRPHRAGPAGAGRRRDTGRAVAVRRARRLLPGRRRLQPVPGGAFHAEIVAGPAPGHLAQNRPHLGGAQPARRAVRRPRQRLHQRPPRSSHRRPAHRAGAQRRRPPAGPQQDRAVLGTVTTELLPQLPRATRPRPPGVPGSAHAARGGRRPRSVDHRQLPPAHPRRDRPGAAAGLGRRRLAAPHPRTASSSSTCRSSRSPSRGSCTATASAYKACATSTRPWPPTSASQSPSATTRGTSARSECSTATGSCAGDQPRARRPDTDAVGRITRGNFRPVHRLFVQIERVLRINDLTVITSDVIEAARSTLVIGDT